MTNETTDKKNLSGVELTQESVLEVRKLEFGKGDLLILKGDYPENLAKEIVDQLKNENPHWEGLCVLVPPDQNIEKLPRPVARALYDQLHEVFGNG